jgi:hypothetical protein
MFGIWLAVAEGTCSDFAAGGSSARSEVSRMVTEKVSYDPTGLGAEAVAILTGGGSGRRVIRRYRTRSSRNLDAKVASKVAVKVDSRVNASTSAQ